MSIVEVISPDKWRSLQHNKDCTFCLLSTIYRTVPLFFSLYFTCVFRYNFSFIIQTLDLQLRSLLVAFHDIMDSGECPGHSYSGEQSIFNCPIAKFTVRLAAAAREGRVGVQPVLAPHGVVTCPCCDLGSRKDRAAQLSDAGLHPSSTTLNHSSCDRSALTLLKFVPCQC